MASGTVKKVVADRGFGFITGEDGKDYFFHRDGLTESLDFDRIVGGDYPRRGDSGPMWRDDVVAGLRHYTNGAQNAAERAGETARKMREAFDRGFRGSSSPPSS